MSVECADPVLSTGYPKVHCELYIEVLAGANTSNVTLEVMPPCFESTEIVSLGMGETKELICPTYNEYYWTVKYIEYYSYYAARILICKELTPEAPPETPPAEDNTGLFTWIVTALTNVVVGVRDAILEAMADPIITINGIKTSITGLLWSIEDIKDDLIIDSTNRFSEVTQQIGTLEFPTLESITGLLDPVKMQIAVLETAITDKISDLINPIKTQLEGLDMPTVDSIKEGFLSLTVEFAEGLWDRILDKIEERYNK